ncbi:hypothetical protein SteCoe_34096 [Stentor coeruleus]|uniref:Autophagy-related protein 11 C-terminal domain-containing protein n=1 Tax=Stentor coeruleus TaxID=5963 RepID=A0A1R2AV78_9CILI|nr:hypothetical protein SteCoe_34096 [Stentor coeruleus]
MNIALRYPETGREIKVTLSSGNLVDDLNSQLVISFGADSESFILLNSEGLSLKDKMSQGAFTESIYVFLKDSIRKDKQDLTINFPSQQTPLELPLQGEERGVLAIEKSLYKFYTKSIEYTDFFTSYELFTNQIENEMNIVACGKQVLELYHNKHIQDQVDKFNTLYKKNLVHYESALGELSAFENSVANLTSFKIHKQLQYENRETLADLIDTVQLMKWKESYIAETGRLQTKFQELEKNIQQLPYFYQLPSLPNSPLKVLNISEEMKIAINFGSSVYLDYRQLCEKYNSTGDAQAGKRLHEEKWDKKIAQANYFLAYVETNIEEYRKSIEDIKQQRKTANIQLFTLLKKITEYAARIRDTIKSQLSMLSSLLKRSEKRLAFIKVPKLLPEAHDSAILEISRRNHFVKAATELQNRLSELIEIEIAERISFLDKFKHVLPNNFVPQLSAGPFIKIFAPADEPDLSLPVISDSNFENIDDYFNAYMVKYCKDEKFLLEQENYKKIKALKEVESEIQSEKEKLYEQNKKLSLEIKQKEKVMMDTIAILDNFNIEFKRKDEEIESLKQKIVHEKASNEEKMQSLAQLLSSEKVKSQEKFNEMELNFKQALQDAENNTKSIIQKLNESEKMKNLLKLELELEFEKSQKEEHKKVVNQRSPEFENLCKELKIEPSYLQLKEYILALQQSESSKICFTSFNKGSLALFFPTSEGQFLAFNYNCPDHYLNIDSISGQSIEMIQSQPYIVGVITDKKKIIAQRNNPFMLPLGQEFYLLSIKE